MTSHEALFEQRKTAIRGMLRANVAAPKEAILGKLASAGHYNGFGEEEAAAARKADAKYIWQYRGSLKTGLANKKATASKRTPKGVPHKQRVKAPRNVKQDAVGPLVVQVNVPDAGMVLHVNDSSGRRVANLLVTRAGVRYQPVGSKSPISLLPEMPWVGLQAMTAFGNHMSVLGRMEKA